MDELMPIGRFSRMSRLSIKALRVYDEVGLLHPAYVDPATGYRYYRPGQAATARVIATLRSLDMPLAAVRELVTESDPDRVRELLDGHRLVLEQRVDRHRHMLRRAETFARKGTVVTYEITIREIAAADVVGTVFTTAPEAIAERCGPVYQLLQEALTAAGSAPAGPPRLRYRDMTGDEWTLEAAVPVTDPVALAGLPDELVLRHDGGGRAAVTRHTGPYEELGIAYREVETWIETNGLAPAGEPYDVYLNDPSEVDDPGTLETEIVWPVRPV